MKHNDVIENRILIYESDDDIKVEVILEEENIWLTQVQISKLYNKAKSTINEHIKNIYLELPNFLLSQQIIIIWT